MNCANLSINSPADDCRFLKLIKVVTRVRTLINLLTSCYFGDPVRSPRQVPTSLRLRYGAPAVMAYCQRNNCAVWTIEPINSFGFWTPDNVRITTGEDNFGMSNKTETNFPNFCKTCGSHVFCDFPGFNFVEVYPNTLPDFVHEPTIHVHYGSKTISVHDGLLIFKGLPTDFGGFGEMLPD